MSHPPTLKYIDSETVLFRIPNDEFHVKVATHVQEACALNRNRL